MITLRSTPLRRERSLSAIRVSSGNTKSGGGGEGITFNIANLFCIACLSTSRDITSLNQVDRRQPKGWIVLNNLLAKYSRLRQQVRLKVNPPTNGHASVPGYEMPRQLAQVPCVPVECFYAEDERVVQLLLSFIAFRTKGKAPHSKHLSDCFDWLRRPLELESKIEHKTQRTSSCKS